MKTTATYLTTIFLTTILFCSTVSAADYDVGWTDVVGISISGNDLTKTAGTAWGNAGSASTVAHSGSFAVEFSTSETNMAKVCGLSSDNTNSNYTTIDFAVHLKSNGDYVIRESGTQKASLGAYATSDVFKVKRSGTTITYLKNDSVVYTSLLTSTGTLLADTAFYNNGATLDDVRFIGVPTYVPSTISDLGSEIGDEEIVLSWSAPSSNGATISEYVVQYGTVTSGTFGSSYTDDSTPGATITGLTNGTQYQFRVIAKNSVGSSEPSNVVKITPNILVDVDWYSIVGVSETGNDITKTAATGWGNGGAVSFDAYVGDLFMEFTAIETNTGRACGFSSNNVSSHYSDIEFAVHLQSDGSYRILENGNIKFDDSSSYSTGDIFQVGRSGTTITFYRNGTEIYTSTATSSGSLMVDSALYNINSTITDAKIAGNIDSLLGSVSHSNNAFDPRASETSTISFTLDSAADVTIDLYEANFSAGGTYSRTYLDTLLDDDGRSAGVNTFVWDGKDSSGNYVSSGVYVYTIEGVSPGETFTYDPTYYYGVVTVDDATFAPENFDPYKGEIATVTYDLLVPAWVTLRVGITTSQSEVAKLVDLDPRDTQNIVEVWDGRDSNGDIVDAGEYTARIWTRLIPNNGIIVENNRDGSIDEVFADPYAMFAVYGEATEITYELSEAADVTVTIIDPSGTTIRTLVDDVSKIAGTYTVEWDGEDSSGDIVDEEGNYRVRVSITQDTTTKIREGNITVFR